MDEITFDEWYVKQQIQAALKEAFDTEEWKLLFGGRAMTFYNSQSEQSPKFPCTIVTIVSPVPYTRMTTSRQEEEFTQFDFEIEQYNQEVLSGSKKMSKEELGVKINHQTKLTLQQKFGLTITANTPLQNIDDSIYRRSITGRAIIDNVTNTIYK